MSLFSRNTKPSDLAPDPALVAKVRAYLAERYDRRFCQKLADRQPVNLRILPSLSGTSPEGAKNYKTLKEEEVRAAIGDIFNQANGRLLLVGLPGAGKTTLVLQLALHLLESPIKSMAVVLNLATWRSEFKTFDEWLHKILPAELGASPTLAEQIRKKTSLILLLDGLDEVPEPDRTSCLTAIGEYGADATSQFLISSRITEYAGTKDAPVNAQVEVAQLTIDQVEAGLTATAHIQPESKRLLNALKSDPLLRQAVENPFYLNTAQLLFASGKSWSEFGFVAEDLAGRQRELVERFVEKALTRTDKYPVDKARHWLAFLASRMTQRNMVVFELRDLQYDWWEWSKGRILLARLFGGLVFALVGALVFALFFGLAVGLVFGLVFGLVGGLVYALVVVLVFSLVGGLPNISTKDTIHWSWKNIIFYIRTNLVGGLVSGLSIGLIVGLVGGLVSGLVVGLIVGLVGALVGALVFGLVFGLVDLMGNSTDIIQISTPYQRFHASNRALYFSILQHKLLYRQLRKQGLLPPDLVPFLKEMSNRHILETDGATWRFRHRILQDYFAGLWVEPKA